MKFKAFNKNLRLIVKHPWREVQNGYPIDHLEESIQFRNGWFDTEDEKQIEFLKKHRLFSGQADVESRFWIHVDPIDTFAAKLSEKDREIEELKNELKEKAKQEPKKDKPPFCDTCDSKGATHKKDCPKNPKTAPEPIAA